MRIGGRDTRGGLALLFVAILAGVAAAEVAVATVPVGDAYVVTAVLIPGVSGAEVCGDEKGQGHVDFRIGFVEQRLFVNGLEAGSYDPCAAYHVSVICQKQDGVWLATTHIMNQNTGVVLFHQDLQPMGGAPERFFATAEHVIHLCVQ